MFPHLAEAFFDGAEVGKDVVPHHSVFLPLQPDIRQALALHRLTLLFNYQSERLLQRGSEQILNF